MHVDLIKLYGSMELAPLTGLADAIVDLVSTGSTLKANHLVEVEQIMDISARLVVNQAALKLKREPIRALDRRLRGGGRRRSAMTRRASAASTPRAPDFEAEFQRVLHWSAETDAAIEQRVAEILADVRQRGDAAVLEYTARFDGAAGRVGGRARDRAAPSCAPRSTAIPPAQRDALRGRRRSACAATTSASSRPAAAAGATATPTARCSARRSRRWTASASTCRAARRPIRRAC